MLTVGELLDRINDALARGDVERDAPVQVKLSGAGEPQWLDASMTGSDPDGTFFIAVSTGAPPADGSESTSFD